MSEGRFHEVSAAILLGGESRRMGRDKAAIPADGVPWVTALAGGLETLFEDVLLVGGKAPAGTPGRVVCDPDGPASALRGLVGALEAATTDKLFVVATDYPGLGAELVLGLLAWPEADAVVPRTDHGLQPLCAVYRREPALGAARSCLGAGRLALRDVLAELDVRELAGADLAAIDPTGLGLANVNTPAELASFERGRAAHPERRGRF